MGGRVVRHKRYLLGLLLLWLAVSPPLAMAESFAVIVAANHPVAALSSHQVQRIFLGKMKKWPNGEAVHIAFNSSEPTNGMFTHQVLRKTPRQLSSYWRKALYSGRSMLPLYLADDQQVLDYVADHPNVISVVAEPVTDPRVKRVLIQP